MHTQPRVHRFRTPPSLFPLGLLAACGQASHATVTIQSLPHTRFPVRHWYQWGMCLLIVAGVALLLTVAAIAVLLIHTDAIHQARIMAEYHHAPLLTV